VEHEYNTRTVTLHGGPWHGRIVALVVEANHFHINMFPYGGTHAREGTYSQVSGPNNQNNFEWDGWVSH